jgi:hypothetical protein
MVRRRYHHPRYHILHHHHLLLSLLLLLLHVRITDLGHVLTRFGLTHPEISSIVFHFSLRILLCSFLLTCVTCYEPFCLHVYYVSSVFLYFVLNWGFIEFLCDFCISNMFHHAVVVVLLLLLPASIALIFQFSLSCNKAGRHGTLYNFILIFLNFSVY